jgi:protein CpxP
MKSSNKILTIAVVLLLLTNITLVAFMVLGKNKQENKRPPGRNDPFEVMVKELNMTDQQQKDYKQQKEEHFKNIRPLFDSVRAAKSAFFALLKETDVNDSVVNLYSQRVTEKQAAIDKLTFAHFRRVRNLFTPEQQPKFDVFVQKMMQRGKKDSTAKKEK